MLRQPFIYALFFFFSALAAHGQDHQTNKKTLSRHLREVYDVVKTDWKIKDGAYTVINDAGFPVVRGLYTNGKKSGIWSYYDNDGKLVQQYDFNHDSLLIQAVDSASVVHDDFQIPQGVEDGSKLRAPYKIGGPEYGFYLLFDDRDIPQVVKSNSTKAEMTYVLTIDEHGKLESYMVLFAGESIDDVVVRRSVKGLPEEALEYVCATIDGHPVRSKISYTIPLDVNHTSTPGNNYQVTQHPTN
jgi:hypothetical protein